MRNFRVPGGYREPDWSLPGARVLLFRVPGEFRGRGGFRPGFMRNSRVFGLIRRFTGAQPEPGISRTGARAGVSGL